MGAACGRGVMFLSYRKFPASNSVSSQYLTHKIEAIDWVIDKEHNTVDVVVEYIDNVRKSGDFAHLSVQICW